MTRFWQGAFVLWFIIMVLTWPDAAQADERGFEVVQGLATWHLTMPEGHDLNERNRLLAVKWGNLHAASFVNSFDVQSVAGGAHRVIWSGGPDLTLTGYAGGVTGYDSTPLYVAGSLDWQVRPGVSVGVFQFMVATVATLTYNF